MLKVHPALKYGWAFVSSLAFTPESSTLAAGVFNMTGEGTDKQCGVNLWDLATGKEIRTFTGSVTSYPCVAFTADGTGLALANARKATLWGVSSGQGQFSLEMPDRAHVSSISVSPGGKVLAF